jgi:hypothetical protein
MKEEITKIINTHFVAGKTDIEQATTKVIELFEKQNEELITILNNFNKYCESNSIGDKMALFNDPYYKAKLFLKNLKS